MASTHEVVFGSLNGTVFAPDDGDCGGRALLFVHGLGSQAATYEHRAVRVCDTVAIRCLTFDLRGHGPDSDNVDRYSVYDHLQDTVAAYDFLDSGGADVAPRVGACGASYGGYLAAMLSTQRSLRGLMLRAPALAIDVEFPDPNAMPFGRHVAAGPGEFDSLSALSRFTGPLVIVESENDERIPHSQIEEHLAANRGAQHEVIPGARHALSEPAWDSVFIETIIRWARDL